MDKKTKRFKIATIVISIVSVAAITTLSIFLGVTSKARASVGNDLENIYHRAFYELLSDVNALEISYSKLMVTSSKNMQIEILNDIAKDSHMAGVSLSTLSAQNYGVINTTRYINQAGDFAMSLVNNLVKGNSLTEADYDMLESLHKMTKEMGDELRKISDEIAKGKYAFIKKLNDDKDVFAQVFKGLEESIVEYPAMIYDGPFSTALLDKKAKGLPEKEITAEEGVSIINAMLKDYKIKDVKHTGDCKSFFDCYNYEGKTQGDESVSIDLSKKGGRLISLNIPRTVNEPKYSPEECAKLAEQHAKKLGFENMESVWVSNYNSVIYVNLAPVINNVVWYPDLVKVKISSNNGELVGVEALSYAYNHIERQIEAPVVSEAQARAGISTRIKVETCRLALIPYKDGKEILTYEFSGKSDDSVYYVYIDAKTGEEIKVLRVIDSDEGTLLM